MRAHRYVHAGEPGWGAAPVNDSTYGHDVTRDVRPDGGTTTAVRLILLRAARFPDPDADQASTPCGTPWWWVWSRATRYARATT